jgi:SAM-dependent methyltransferase
MNATLSDDHPSIQYYESDYPSRDAKLYPENFDETVALQGLADDVERFKDLASEAGWPILELCCGSGRVTIPLARAGFDVTGVDISRGMLELLNARLVEETPSVRQRVTAVHQDVTCLDLERRDFALVIVPFNSLLCITDFAGQCAVLRAAARHLGPGGLIVLDLINPLILPLAGDEQPRPFLHRRNTRTGNPYTRFAAVGPMDGEQKQRLYGWYDEIFPDGTLHRTSYEMFWRPIFRYEIELMLDREGFDIVSVEGGHRREPFTASSRKLFVVARKREPVA